MADDTAELIQRMLARGPTEEDLARKRSMESENVGQFFKDAWGNLKGIVKTPYDVLEKGIPATFGDPGAGRRARQAASEAAAMGYPVAQSVIPGAAPTGALPAPQAAPVAPPAPAAVAPVARARALPPQAGAIGMVPQAQANALEGAIPPQATPVAAPVAPPVAPVAAPVVPKSTLVEEYSKALEKLKTTDTSGRLTAEQQYRSELSFWLNMLAAASEPGARAGGAIGKAGAAALEGMTKQETENKKAAMEMLKSNKEDVYRLAMLADKQGDNELAQAKLNSALGEHRQSAGRALQERGQTSRKRKPHGHRNVEGLPCHRQDRTGSAVPDYRQRRQAIHANAKAAD